MSKSLRSLLIIGGLVVIIMASFRTRMGKLLGAAVGADRVYTRLIAEQYQLTEPAQLKSACESLPPGKLEVGIAVCALAEQGYSSDVFSITKARLFAAIEAGSESNEAFMLGKAVVMCGEGALPLLDELSANPNPKVRKWALLNYGFIRDSDAALNRLVDRLRRSEGEEMKTILFSISQHGSVRAGVTILEMLNKLPTETRIAASRFLMSCRLDESLRHKAQVLHDSEHDMEVRRNLENFLGRF